MWKQVCSCMTDTYTCNATCLSHSLRQKSHYYTAVRDLYHNVTARYPAAETVWLSGHSLGGVVSALLGLTYGLPTLTFEAFPDALAAQRLGLPTPPGYRIGSHAARGASTGLHHFGHTADPIFMGTCNTASSFCSIAGYAFQGVCHTGVTCTYDTVGDLGWRVGIGTHKIGNVIRDVLERYDTVPGCEEDVECQDCFNWRFFESNGSEPITSTSTVTSSSSSSSATRTETCRTPGWWGCLDETTTTTSTSATSTSTSTCKTPGWFGCKDPTTTTTTTTTATATAPRTNLPSSGASAPVPAHAPTTPPSHPPSSTRVPPPTSTSTSRRTPGWWGGCWDRTTAATTAATTTTTTIAKSAVPSSRTMGGSSSRSPAVTGPGPGSGRGGEGRGGSGRKRKCVEWGWLGGCRRFGEDDELEGARRRGDL